MNKKNIKRKFNPNNKKTVYQLEAANSYDTKKPSWRFSKCDKAHDRWCVNEDNYAEIVERLRPFETMTWNEIKSASGGKKAGHGSNSHNENVADFIKEARDRLVMLNLDEYDQLFSLRLANKPRIYGILEDAVLDIIWYDKNHEIYPSNE